MLTTRGRVQQMMKVLPFILMTTLLFFPQIAFSQAKFQLVSMTSNILEKDTDVQSSTIDFPTFAQIRIPNGATLFLFAVDIIINPHVFIDGRGNDGNPGQPGKDAIGEWKSKGDDSPDSCKIAHERWEMSGFSQADRGENGRNGEDGGRGATIVIRGMNIVGINNLSISVIGGKGGPGGSGGRGRKLVCGCHNDEVKYGLQGIPGQPGNNGPNGQSLSR